MHVTVSSLSCPPTKAETFWPESSAHDSYIRLLQVGPISSVPSKEPDRKPLRNAALVNGCASRCQVLRDFRQADPSRRLIKLAQASNISRQ
jgi:hypothetical protein